MKEGLIISVEDLEFLTDKMKAIYPHRENHKVQILNIDEDSFHILPVIPNPGATDETG